MESFCRGRMVYIICALVLFFAPFVRAQEGAHIAKARQLYANQIYLSAIGEAKLQLKDTPSSAETWLFIAQVYLDLKKYPEALDAALAAIKIAPANAACEQMAERVSRSCASCGPSALVIGRAYMQAGSYQKAISSYRRYLKSNPSDSTVRLELAKILSWSKDYPSAIEEYENYLHRNPKNRQAVIELADIYSWSNNLPMAETQFKAALALAPNDAAVHAKLGNVFEWQGKFEEARSEYRQALDISPKESAALQGLARIKTAEDKAAYLETSDGVQESISKSHDYSLYMRLADMQYQAENNKPDALANYRKYLQHFPDDYDAKMKVARVFGWEKLYPDSIALYKEYLKQYPNDSSARIELANVLAWQDRSAEALAELDKVRRKKPAMPAVWLAQGDINKWQGNYTAARESYRTALDLQPDNPAAQAGLRDVEQAFPIRPQFFLRNSNIVASDIDYSRMSFELGGKFHLKDGAYELSPGVRTHKFEQGDSRVNAREAYLEGGGFIRENWRWFAGASYLNILDYTSKMQAKLGVSSSISTSTWLSGYYVSQDAVFDTNNLSAILARKNISMDTFNAELVHKMSKNNQISGFVSEGTFSDGNSRTRLNMRFTHDLYGVPLVKVGGAYKLLSYSTSSEYYWAPASYSGISFVASLEHKIESVSYRLGMEICRIMDASQTEASMEGEVLYRPQDNFFAGMNFGFGRGGGSMVDGTNSVFKTISFEVGYNF